jgi:hypothetical protein
MFLPYHADPLTSLASSRSCFGSRRLPTAPTPARLARVNPRLPQARTFVSRKCVGGLRNFSTTAFVRVSAETPNDGDTSEEAANGCSGDRCMERCHGHGSRSGSGYSTGERSVSLGQTWMIAMTDNSYNEPARWSRREHLDDAGHLTAATA